MPRAKFSIKYLKCLNLHQFNILNAFQKRQSLPVSLKTGV